MQSNTIYNNDHEIINSHKFNVVIAINLHYI